MLDRNKIADLFEEIRIEVKSIAFYVDDNYITTKSANILRNLGNILTELSKE